MSTMRTRIAAMVAMVMMLMMMSAAPALGKSGNNGHQTDDGPDKNKGGGQEKLKNDNQKNGQHR